ncbi:bifunctional DNA primase/polymerase [Embleya sp. NBC_00888]|uniref:bifunctional DNA primase/polymerase n=1 Tax=Embleya sp. NBC_00888 TaxID=2975960 RepID=UPI0038697674|nr:bifunctional DNA primase/polymerase [Embleya sp. NBC_00888]
MTRPNPTLKAAALTLAERGWHVFPLVPNGKKPAVAGWQERATTDAERIARCWDHGAYNIGLATGPTRLLVVDLDKPKTDTDVPPAEWAEQGATDGADVFALLALTAEQPYPGDTFTVGTPTGGQHLYYLAPDGIDFRNTAGKLGWKVDTRAVGGYVVAPGSLIDGAPYAILNDTAPAPLPEWLAELLRPAPLPPQEPVMIPVAIDRRTAYLNAAVNGQLDKILKSPEHGHNIALYHSAVALGQLVAGGELSESDVTNRLMSAALQVGQPEREARGTIRSGLAKGRARPRTVAA